MQQLDLFDETLQKKIHRMEKWVGRLQKEIWFLKTVYDMSKKTPKNDTFPPRIDQMDIFGT